MEVLTAAGMAATDRRTVELGIPIFTLMENAGATVAEFCLHRFRRARRIVVLAGRGNNGGDGTVAARQLAAAGREVSVLLLGHAEDVKAEAAQALRRLREESPQTRLYELPDEASFQAAAAEVSTPDLVLDAVVGTGFKPPLRGVAAAARDWLAPLSVPVVAVDLPSGWDADSTAQDAPDAFRADAVVSFTAPKYAHVFGHLARPNPDLQGPGAWPFGPVVVAGIGSPTQAVTDSLAPGGNVHWAGSAKPLADEPRPVNANKGRFGHVLVVGGSRGTAGAPSMSSLAALRTGAGLVTAAVPNSIADLVALAAVELMVVPTHDTVNGGFRTASLKSVQAAIQEKRITVLAVGPGLSNRGEAPQFARDLVARTALPIVIDADAVNAFADCTRLLKAASTLPDSKPRTVVLTPHPGEMARLANLTVAQVEADRVGLARRFATEHGIILVLKGWRTLIAHPDGRIAVNTTGNPGMAKGGSGDILTGIIAAMLAQYPDDPAEAVEAAVYLHGLAGDLAARDMDQHTVLATDTLDHLSAAFRYRTRDRNGFTWISGLQPRGNPFGQQMGGRP